MKKSYKLGAHKIALDLKTQLAKPNQCGIAHWESKSVEVRTTNASNGQPYELPAMLVVFFHEFFHMIDLMQGTDLFNDLDLETDLIKETLLDSFCEGFVSFMLTNKLLTDKWVKDWENMLKKVKPLEIEKETTNEGEREN